ncbi:CubicO group peptidase, beta-lactamase class C family [Natrinema salaciae]|uniref:CubicO group peptidase, beta-lactamase class C family n=1 Tax=Natrinema salaciae TaxID=1186196 RepID=A0A1H9FDG8_9EURY|nr:CubicO group peptidase, beta-lactamase class C family [Natrinema salaciae]
MRWIGGRYSRRWARRARPPSPAVRPGPAANRTVRAVPRATTETRHILFSATKPYAAASVHLLADRGELSYDDRIVEHWSAFAEAGSEKAAVTVRHLLSHRAGLSQLPAIDDEPSIWGDPDAIARRLEAADLEYAPGERAQYHILSFGWLTGELVRQVTGRRIDRFAREELFEPLGMDRTHIGLPAGDPDDVATLVGFEPYDQIEDPAPADAAYNQQVAEQFNSEAVHRAVVPAANGVGTAGDMARFYACLLNGGELEGTRLFSPETVREWTSLEAERESDPVRGGSPGRFSLGFFLGGLVHSSYGVTAPPSTFGHGGLGSIMGWADPVNDLAFAYVTNGIRDGYEHGARATIASDTVRHELG